jgi:hypothetical protein
VHALDPPVGDRSAAVERDAVVEGHVAGDAEGGGLRVEGVRELRIVQERFRGDAPDVQAHSAPVLLLDHRGAQAELSGADGGDVPAGAGAEDDDIEMAGHCDSLGACAAERQGVGCRGEAVAADLRRIRDKHVGEHVRASVAGRTLDR